MSAITPSISFPAQFEKIANLTARAYGTGDLATRLMMLNAIGAAAGNSVLIRTPEFREYIPALNLGIVSGGDAPCHGALMTQLASIIFRIRAAVEIRQIRGPQLTQASLESLVRERDFVTTQIERESRELEELGPLSVATHAEQAAAAADIFGSSDKPPGPFRRREELSASRRWCSQPAGSHQGQHPSSATGGRDPHSAAGCFVARTRRQRCAEF